GIIHLVNRSLYGSYYYYHHTELAHRGSVIYPGKVFLDKFQVKNESELEFKMGEFNYLNLLQLKKALRIANYIPFDLNTNNLTSNKQTINLEYIQDNYKTYHQNMLNNINQYHLENIKIALDNELIVLNSNINSDLKVIIKNSLLNITKQEEQLYYNIYYIVEKACNYFYKQIIEELNTKLLELSDSYNQSDFDKVKDDLKYNKEMLILFNNRYESIMKEINNTTQFKLNNYFNFKDKTIKPLKPEAVFSKDYHYQIFTTINYNLDKHLVNNKGFIKQVDSFINKALTASKVSLHVPFLNKHIGSTTKDIDFIKEHYNFNEIIANAVEVFNEDFYEAIIGDSLIYVYYSNMRCINEHLMQYLEVLDNLSFYLNEVYPKKKHLLNLILLTKDDVNELIKYNHNNIF
ncbi:MAG: hypothetical protein ACRCTA_07615, partial [Bacilli bacterium]